MRHEIEHAVALEHALPRRDRDAVAGLDCERGVDFDVRVDDDQVAHLAGAQVVHAVDARRLEQCAPDCLDLLLGGRAVDEVVQRIPAEAPAHPRDHEADDQSCDRIEDRVTRQVADDADADDQRGRGVRAGVPGVRHEHARLDAFGDDEHVAEQDLLGRERGESYPQCGEVDPRHALGILELAECRPQHAEADDQQQHAEQQRSRGLEALVPVRVIRVGVLLAGVAREQHAEVGHQVRQ